MPKVKTLLKVGLGLTVVALLLEIVGFVGPAWVIYSINLGQIPGNPYTGLDKMVTNAGVWWVNLCFHSSGIGTSCITSSQHDESTLGVTLSDALDDLGQINWIELAVFTTLGLAGSIAAVVIISLAIGKCIKVNRTVLGGIAAGILVVSGGFLFAAVIKVASKITSTRRTLDLVNALLGYDLITLGDPWACIVTGFTLPLIGIAVIVLFVAACQREKTPGQVLPPGNSMGMSSTPGKGQKYRQGNGPYPIASGYNTQANNYNPHGVYVNQGAPIQPHPYSQPYPTTQ